MSLREVRLLINTLIHLRTWQIAGRIIAKIRFTFEPLFLPEVPEELTGGLHFLIPPAAHDPWNSSESILRNEFTFLNRPKILDGVNRWAVSDVPLLWEFNLHYFNFLYLLSDKEASKLCCSWISHNPYGKTVGWHPYPTSLRIVNWCKRQPTDSVVLSSLYLQAAYLYRNLETYVGGNHLLENARALVFAGMFFGNQGEAPAWLKRGKEIISAEIEQQILADGGHYERSPMYHAIVLDGFLDILNVISSEDAIRPKLELTVSRMCDVLVSYTHPDGTLALFNDSTQEISRPTSDIIEDIKSITGYSGKHRSELPDSGYFSYKNDDLYFIIDAGAGGPDHLLAHAHADIFSFELSVKGTRMIVDSGVYEYEAGTMRNYARSTAAHNTVSIDGVDQIECWHSFRVARRYAPEQINVERADSGLLFSGTYSGFSHLIGDGIVHRRHIAIIPETRTIEITDTISGRGSHLVESRLHLHPDMEIQSNDEPNGSVFMASRDDSCVSISAAGARSTLAEGWHCPKFGNKQNCNVIVHGGHLELPVTLSIKIEY